VSANPNPYAPPVAEVADSLSVGGPASGLWNPNAAASWCLVFSPVFGSLLHMYNWRALGEHERAQSSRNWAIGVLAIIVLFVILDAVVFARIQMRLTRIVGLIVLLGWYFGSAKEQIRYVNERFGKDYPRRSWTKPLLWAVLASVVFFLGLAVVVAVVGIGQSAGG
jgi:hypothetical protein